MSVKEQMIFGNCETHISHCGFFLLSLSLSHSLTQCKICSMLLMHSANEYFSCCSQPTLPTFASLRRLALFVFYYLKQQHKNVIFIICRIVANAADAYYKCTFLFPLCLLNYWMEEKHIVWNSVRFCFLWLRSKRQMKHL